MHPLIGNLCHRPDGGTDHALYVALHTTMPLDEALDLAEIDTVGRSWRDAMTANLERATTLTEQPRKRGRKR